MFEIANVHILTPDWQGIFKYFRTEVLTLKSGKIGVEKSQNFPKRPGSGYQARNYSIYLVSYPGQSLILVKVGRWKVPNLYNFNTIRHDSDTICYIDNRI